MNHLDLCSGIGGFALAAGWHGFRTIGFCEIDPFCQAVLRRHWPETPIHDDLTTLPAGTVRDWIDRADFANVPDTLSHRREAVLTTSEGHERPRGRTPLDHAGPTDRERPAHIAATLDANADLSEREAWGTDRLGAGTPTGTPTRPGELTLLTAGYPCQPFSHAGKRLGAADDRHLWPAIAALVGDLRPRWCLFENVAGHASMGLDDVLADLEGLGYAWGAAVVPACAVGAPHRRDRVWILAHAEDGGVRRGGAPGEPGQSARGGEATRHSDGTGTQGERRAEPAGRRVAGGDLRDEAVGELGWSDDGLPRRVARLMNPRWQGDPRRAFGPWWEDGVPRTTAHEDKRAAKLKALGNAIVPQVAYELMRPILEVA